MDQVDEDVRKADTANGEPDARADERSDRSGTDRSGTEARPRSAEEVADAADTAERHDGS
jgi:hypothetical protein